MHAAAVTSSIMQLSFSKFHLAPKNFKLSCVQLMISSGSPLNVLHFSSLESMVSKLKVPCLRSRVYIRSSTHFLYISQCRRSRSPHGGRGRSRSPHRHRSRSPHQSRHGRKRSRSHSPRHSHEKDRGREKGSRKGKSSSSSSSKKKEGKEVSTEEAEIREANELRAKLGLKPLRT